MRLWGPVLTKDHLIISIAAGVTLNTLEAGTLNFS